MTKLTTLQQQLLHHAAKGYSPAGATQHSQMRVLERRLLVAEVPANERPNPFGRFYRITARGKAVLREKGRPLLGLGSTLERVG